MKVFVQDNERDTAQKQKQKKSVSEPPRRDEREKTESKEKSERKPSKKPVKMTGKEAKNKKKELRKSDSFSVVVVQESIVSQILVFLEVAAGAFIMLFIGAQVGNILINKIVSGMLGG